MTHKVYLRVKAESMAETDQLVTELQSFLRQRTEHVTIERAKEKPSTQDAGTILVAALATPAIVELAKGIADWMRKRNVAVTLSGDGSKTFEGPPEHVERILREVLTDTSQSKDHAN